MKNTCPHIHFPTAYPHPPTTVAERYDDVTLLLEYVGSVFSLIKMAMEGREEEVNTMAGLGETMCEELHRRAEVLYHSIHDPEPPHE